MKCPYGCPNCRTILALIFNFDVMNTSFKVLKSTNNRRTLIKRNLTNEYKSTGPTVHKNLVCNDELNRKI